MASGLPQVRLWNALFPQTLAGAVLEAAETGDGRIDAMKSQMAGENGDGLVAIGAGREHSADIITASQRVGVRGVAGNVERVPMDEFVGQRAQHA